MFFHHNFRKTFSKYIPLFRLHCLPEWKRHIISLNLGDLQWFCLFFSSNERISVRISPRATFYLFAVARVGAVYLQFYEGCNLFAPLGTLPSEQVFHYIHCNTVIMQSVGSKAADSIISDHVL